MEANVCHRSTNFQETGVNEISYPILSCGGRQTCPPVAYFTPIGQSTPRISTSWMPNNTYFTGQHSQQVKVESLESPRGLPSPNLSCDENYPQVDYVPFNGLPQVNSNQVPFPCQF